MTLEEAKKLHYELWDWLAKNQYKLKTEWPGWKKCGTVSSLCFACEYCKQLVGCENCPIDWPGGDCSSDESPYEKWIRSDFGSEDAVKYAIEVRDIKWKK